MTANAVRDGCRFSGTERSFIEARLPVAARWREVEDDMDECRAHGITATRSDVINAYLDTVHALPGSSRTAIWEDYLDATETSDAPS